MQLTRRDRDLRCLDCMGNVSEALGASSDSL